MKILLVTPYFKCSKHGGTERYVSNLYDNIKATHSHGVDISVLTTKCDNCNPEQGIYKVNSIKELFNFNPLCLNIIKIYSIIKKTNNYHLIHVHGHLYFLNFFAAIIGKILKKKVILTLHGGVSVPENVPLKSKIFKIAYDKIFGNIFKKIVDGIVSVSKTDLQKYTIHPNSNVEKWYIPNAIDITKFEYKNLYQQSKRKFVIGYVGDLEYWKGTDILLDITKKFASNANIEVLIAGEGYYKNQFIKLSKKHKNVKYLGKIKHSEVPEFFHKLDLFIFPSRWEGLPTTILEAMASGCIVLANQLPELKRIFDSNVIEFVEKPLCSSFVLKINKLINDKKNLYSKAINARKLVETHLSIEKITEKYLELYKLILSKK